MTQKRKLNLPNSSKRTKNVYTLQNVKVVKLYNGTTSAFATPIGKNCFKLEPLVSIEEANRTIEGVEYSAGKELRKIVQVFF